MGRAILLLLAGAAASGLALAWLLRPPPGPPPPPRGFVLEAVTVVNPGAGRRERVTLVAEGGRIASIAPSPGRGRAAGEAHGRFVLPGLIDLHVHHPPRFALGERELFALLFLTHGVTSVRDTGVTSGSLLPLAARIDAGRAAGPRLFSCERIVDGEPPGWPSARVVHDPGETRLAVAAAAREGAACVKLYNGLDAPRVRAAQLEAARVGLPVVAHVAWDARLADYRGAEIQHLMGLTDVWTELPAATLDAYVETSLRNRLSHTPTLVTFAHAAALGSGAPADGVGGVGALLPAHYRELFWRPERNPLVWALLPGGEEGGRARVAAMAGAVRRLHEAGVPVLAGSDTLNPFVVPGAALREEVGHLASAGLGAEQALAAATARAGRALGVAGLGSLEEGSPADLIVLREDPTRDLAALETLEAVAVDGRLYPAEVLREALARRRAHFESRPVRAVWSAIARTVLSRLRAL